MYIYLPRNVRLAFFVLFFLFFFFLFLLVVAKRYVPTNMIVGPVLFVYVHTVVDDLESCFLVGDAYAYCVATWV